MKILIFIVSLMALTSCNKGSSKHKNNTNLLIDKSAPLDLASEFLPEFRMAKGFSCNVIMQDGKQPLFIEPIPVKNLTKYIHHFASTAVANRTIEDQLDFKRLIDFNQDQALLTQLGFSKKQLAKMEERKATTVETNTIIYFDEFNLTGNMKRKALAKNESGKLIKRSTKTIGVLSDCIENEMEIEIN